MNETGMLDEVRGYCATCRKDFGDANPEYLGRRIECIAPDHLAQVISKADYAKWWLHREDWLLKWQSGRDRCLLCSPFALLRRLQRYLWTTVLKKDLDKDYPGKKIQAGHYLCASFVLIGFGLLFEANGGASWLRWTLAVLISWRFLDIFLSNTSITFTSRLPANSLRSVVFSLLTYIQIALCYGYFYSLLFAFGSFGPIEGCPAFSVIEAVYFSFGGIATVGYGMVEPKNWVGKSVVASELLAGLYFVVIILAQVSGWSTQSKVELGRFPWGELKKR